MKASHRRMTTGSVVCACAYVTVTWLPSAHACVCVETLHWYLECVKLDCRINKQMLSITIHKKDFKKCLNFLRFQGRKKGDPCLSIRGHPVPTITVELCSGRQGPRRMGSKYSCIFFMGVGVIFLLWSVGIKENCLSDPSWKLAMKDKSKMLKFSDGDASVLRLLLQCMYNTSAGLTPCIALNCTWDRTVCSTCWLESKTGPEAGRGDLSMCTEVLHVLQGDGEGLLSLQ